MGGPEQISMDGVAAAQTGHNADLEPVLLSGAASASFLATLGYSVVAAGHLLLLMWHSSFASSADSIRFFGSLAIVEVALAYEAAIFASGAFGRPGNFMSQLLTVAGRVRLLGAAVAWPWLMPWVTEVSCRCGAMSPSTGHMLLSNSVLVAGVLTGFYLLREASFMVRGEPVSALDANATAQVGDCLPSQAVLGGQFRLDKADLEETGRAIFVPARPREGLYIGAGLSLLAHLGAGLMLGRTTAMPPLLLLGAIGCFLGRRWGELPKMLKGSREDGRVFSPWRREGPRLICRFGELFWIACCVLELQRCEATASWLRACEPA